MSNQKIPESVICFKCGTNCNIRDTILCTLCTNRYEFNCIGFSEKLYRIMYKDKKQKWKCQTCIKQSKANTSTTSTNEPNVTLRRKVPFKANTKLAVSPDENVLNSPLTPSSTSYEGNSEIFYDSHVLTQQEILDDSFSVTERVSRSAEHTLLDDTNTVYEFREEINMLKIKLMSAESELENQLLENNQLNKCITKLNKEIQLLKNLCREFPQATSKEHKKQTLQPHIFFTPPRVLSTEDNPERSRDFSLLLKEISVLKQSLLDAQIEIGILNKQIDDLKQELCSNKSIICEGNRNVGVSSELQWKQAQVVAGDSTEEQIRPMTTCSQKLSSSSQNADKVDFNRIHILGTQQCVGLSSALTSSRETSPYGKYKITAETKPYARSAEVLKSYNNINLKTGDILIIGVGENDINLKELTSLLRNIFNKFYFCDILLINIFKNVSISKNNVNNALSRLCNEFNNCQFVYCNNYNLYDICRTINYVIDCINYQNKYLDVTALKKIILRKESRSMQVNCRKGTIPYYFAQKPSTNNIACTNIKPPDTKPSEYKKNTIIDYFPKLNNKTFFRD